MLDDLLAPNLDLVICGTAASHESAARGHYYAGPGNKFWKTLHEVGLTPRELKPEEYRQLLRFGIGLTDVAKGQSGMDRDIDFDAATPEALSAAIRKYTPSWLCFNGKRAAQTYFGVQSVEYGPQSRRVGRTHLYVAPSTSGAASGAWDIAWWEDLARRVRQLRGETGSPQP